MLGYSQNGCLGPKIGHVFTSDNKVHSSEPQGVILGFSGGVPPSFGHPHSSCTSFVIASAVDLGGAGHVRGFGTVFTGFGLFPSHLTHCVPPWGQLGDILSSVAAADWSLHGFWDVVGLMALCRGTHHPR